MGFSSAHQRNVARCAHASLTQASTTDRASIMSASLRCQRAPDDAKHVQGGGSEDAVYGLMIFLQQPNIPAVLQINTHNIISRINIRL